MFKILLEIVRWIQGGSLRLLTIAVLLLLVWGIFSPVGTLVWWLNEGVENLGLVNNQPSTLSPDKQLSLINESSNINCYIVFLPGVGDFSADELTAGESEFLALLVKSHPNCVTIQDVFPYSAANKSLGGQRLLAPVWQFANKDADVLIKIRNLWRFAISADPRYGTIYNQGIADAIMKQMQAKHPIPKNSNQPIKTILIGTSGGVEVALGAAPYLHRWLNTKIYLVSIGGVFNGRNGFEAVEHFYHLRGHQDPIEDIGGIVFPSRWLWNLTSGYNQARLQGRYTGLDSGSHAHDGAKGYFGTDGIGADGMTYVDLTVQKVNQLPIWENSEGGSQNKRKAQAMRPQTEFRSQKAED